MAGALFAFILSYFSPHVYFTVVLLWIGLSLTVVSAAYVTRALRKKQDGSIPIYIRWVLSRFYLVFNCIIYGPEKMTRFRPFRKFRRTCF